MKTLNEFTAERHLIYLKRQKGQLAPWTEDPIMAKYFFTNVFRRLDRTSKTLIRIMYNRHNDQSFMFNVILHRLLSRGEFSEQLGYVVEFHHFRDVYNRRKANEEKLRTEAFTSCQSEETLLSTLWNAWVDGDTIWHEIAKEPTVKHAYDVILKLDGIGRFLAWQIAQDLYMYNAIEETEGFVVLGPGADLGLKLSGNKDFWKVLDELNSSRPDYLPVVMAEDLEHVLCEYAKYVKLSQNTGKKRLYRARVSGNEKSEVHSVRDEEGKA